MAVSPATRSLLALLCASANWHPTLWRLCHSVPSLTPVMHGGLGRDPLGLRAMGLVPMAMSDDDDSDDERDGGRGNREEQVRLLARPCPGQHMGMGQEQGLGKTAAILLSVSCCMPPSRPSGTCLKKPV